MKILYNIYQICFALPVLLVLTVLTALVTIIGSLLGGAHFFRYFPDLRLLGQKLQMDDEEKPAKDSVRRQSMRKRGTYLRRPFQS